MSFAMTFFLLKMALEPAMTLGPQAISLDVIDEGSQIKVQLLANSNRAQKVSYTLEVSGSSTSRHRGSTSLDAGVRQVLSTIKASKSHDWCARVKVEEEGRAPYELSRGPCG